MNPFDPRPPRLVPTGVQGGVSMESTRSSDTKSSQVELNGAFKVDFKRFSRRGGAASILKKSI